MIYGASEFAFRAPSVLSRARRILIKPSASHPVPYPVTTSPAMLSAVIEGIRQVSDADILLLEGTGGSEPVFPIFEALGYNFPRVLTLDVKDCIWVEVDNPLLKPLAMSTFWVPNVILSSDYLISITPLRTFRGRSSLSVMNLLSLLPSSKYRGNGADGWGALYPLGIDRVVADLYFTLPFDLGIIEARQMLTSEDDPARGKTTEYGKIFVGEPYEVDREATETLGLKAGYLDLIQSAKVELEP